MSYFLLLSTPLCASSYLNPKLDDFTEKLVLLLLTAMISGLMVPYILKKIEHRRTLDQKYKEAVLSRQEKLLADQAQFLDSLETLVWGLRYLFMKITYYCKPHQREQQAQAEREYDERFWTMLHDLRVYVSKSRRLVSEAAHSDLMGLYEQFVQLDMRLQKTRRLEEPEREYEFADLNVTIYEETSTNIDRMLNSISKSLKINVSSDMET